MLQTPESLSATEAAIAAGVSVADVNRMIDREILPAELFSNAHARVFRKEACVLISFYFKTADSLTSAARLRTIRNSFAHWQDWSEWRSWKAEESSSVFVSFLPFLNEVETRVNQILEARNMVVSDPEILRGTPVVRGTRIPVYDVGELMNSGTPVSEMKELYPRMTEEQLSLAQIYVKAHPRRGRPTRRIFPKTLEVSVSKRRLSDASIRGQKLAQTTD